MPGPFDNDPFSRLAQFQAQRALQKPQTGFLRGFGSGLGASLASLPELGGLLLPGNDPLERLAATIREKTDIGGSQLGRFTGRLLGEGAQTILGGAGIAKGAARLGFEGLQAAREGGVAAKGIAGFLRRNAPFAPFDAAIGATRAQEEGKSPLGGALGGAALGLGGAAALERVLPGISGVRAAEEAAKLAEFNAARAGQEPLSAAQKTALERLADADTSKIDEFLRAPEGTVNGKVLQEGLGQILELVKRDPDAATSLLAQEGEQISSKITNALGLGDLDIPQVAKLGDELGLEPKQTGEFLGKLLRKRATLAGQDLNLRSQIQKQVAKFGGELSDGFAAVEVLPSATSRFRKNTANVFRAAITAQLATAVRNFEVGLFRSPLAVFEDVAAGALSRTSKIAGVKGSLDLAVESSFVSFKSLSKQGKTDFLRLIDAFPAQKARLLKTPTLEIVDEVTKAPGTPGRVVQKATNFFQIFNRTQETLARRVAFTSRFTARAQSLGIDLEKLAMEGIGAFDSGEQALIRESVSDAVTSSLDVTFAASAKELGIQSENAKSVLRVFQNIPELVLVHPFPRFFANSTKFLMDRLSFGHLAPKNISRVLKQETPAKLLREIKEAKQAIVDAGSSQAKRSIATQKLRVAFAKQGALREDATKIAKASEGLLFLGAGVGLRVSPIAGPKWFQVKVGEDEQGNPRFADIRPFAPISTFAFLGELLRLGFDHGEAVFNDKAKMAESGIEPRDFFDAFLGIRRLSGTALFILDAFNNKKARTSIQKAQRFVQTVFGGFSTPARTLRDLISQVDPGESVFRDVRAQAKIGDVEIPKFLNEFIANLPVAGEKLLPQQESSTRASPIDTPIKVGGVGIQAGPIRQLTGVFERTETPIETESRRLDRSTAARTGIPLLDRETDKVTGQLVEQLRLDDVVRSPQFQQLDEFQRSQFLGNTFRKLREQSRSIALQRNFDQVIEDAVRQLDGKSKSEQARLLMRFQLPIEVKGAILERLR